MKPQQDGPHADVMGVLNGDLPLRDRDATAAHLAGCDACRRELAELALVVGELRDAARHRPVEPAELPPFSLAGLTEVPTPATTPRHAVAVAHRSAQSGRPRRRTLAAAGATVGIAACVALGAGVLIGRSTAPGRGVHDGVSAAAIVRLAALGTPSGATGSAHMTGTGRSQVMHLSLAGLPRPPGGDHYEVWLLDTRTGGTLDVGAAPVGAATVGTAATPARAAYAAPQAVVSHYNAIDVSLQRPADGARHSARSVLRGAIN